MSQLYAFDKKYNNFDFIRLLAALFVVFSHCYDLSGNYSTEPLRKLTSYSFSFYGVRIFFLISGYLIVKSLLRSPSGLIYFYKRALRIFPGLIVAVTITVVLFGPLATSLPMAVYFTTTETYTYFINIFLYRTQLDLPDAFSSVNKTAQINGSLWTLVYEFTFYIALYFSLLVGVLRSRWLILSICILLIAAEILLKNNPMMDNYYPSVNMQVHVFIEFSIYFSIGVLYHLFQKEIVFTTSWGYLATIVFFCIIIFTPDAYNKTVNYFLLPYIIFFFSFIKGRLNDFGKYGDYSYGCYIYAFPIQQLIFYYCAPLQTWLFLFFSLLAVAPFAYFSWNFVESPMLKLKGFISFEVQCERSKV